mgnify:CR=1 FL=1
MLRARVLTGVAVIALAIVAGAWLVRAKERFQTGSACTVRSWTGATLAGRYVNGACQPVPPRVPANRCDANYPAIGNQWWNYGQCCQKPWSARGPGSSGAPGCVDLMPAVGASCSVQTTRGTTWGTWATSLGGTGRMCIPNAKM